MMIIIIERNAAAQIQLLVDEWMDFFFFFFAGATRPQPTSCQTNRESDFWCGGLSHHASMIFVFHFLFFLNTLWKRHSSVSGKWTGHFEWRTSANHVEQKKKKREKKGRKKEVYRYKYVHVLAVRLSPTFYSVSGSQVGHFLFFVKRTSAHFACCQLDSVSPFNSSEHSQQRSGRCRRVAYHPALSMLRRRRRRRRELYCTMVITNFTNYISCGY